MAENNPGSPWLAREWKRFSQNDLYDVLPSSVQGRSLQEDAIRQAKTELKEQDSAINKHLVKKAALEEKLKVWQLDSAVSNSIIACDGSAVNTSQSGLAIEKRIQELKESSKKQDVAIQKHHVSKAALEKGIKQWQVQPSDPGQPSKEQIFGPQGEEPIPIVHGPEKEPARNDVENNTETKYSSTTSVARILGPAEFRDRICHFYDEPPSTGRPFNLLAERSRGALPSREDSSIPAKAPSHHGWDPAAVESDLNSYSHEYHEIESPGNRVKSSRDAFQEPPRQIKETIEQAEKQPRPGGEKQGTVTTGPGKSFTHWLLRRKPSSFGSVMDGMFKKFERVAIGGWPARKSRDKRAVPVEGSVNK